ncbi:hypothetical protein LguiA_026222 [Lonicera macranthoides]
MRQKHESSRGICIRSNALNGGSFGHCMREFRAHNDDTLNLRLKDMALEFSGPIKSKKEALLELGGCVASSPRSCSSDIYHYVNCSSS